MRAVICDKCKYSSIGFDTFRVGHARGYRPEVTEKIIRCNVKKCRILYPSESCEYFEEEIDDDDLAWEEILNDEDDDNDDD